MKNRNILILLCLLCTAQQKAQFDRNFASDEYYLSFSPYITRGYLGYRPEVRPLASPSPYIASRKESRPIIKSLRRKYIYEL